MLCGILQDRRNLNGYDRKKIFINSFYTIFDEISKSNFDNAVSRWNQDIQKYQKKLLISLWEIKFTKDKQLLKINLKHEFHTMFFNE